MNKEKSLTFLQSCIEKVKKATEQDIQFYREVYYRDEFQLLLDYFYHAMMSRAYNIPPNYDEVIKVKDIKEIYKNLYNKDWYLNVMIKPEINKLVYVMDNEGYELSDFFWDGEKWMFRKYNNDEYYNLESDYNVCFWRYQDK